MYDRLLALYRQGRVPGTGSIRLTDAQLDSAVTKGWITAQQAADIRAAVDAEILAALGEPTPTP